MARLKSRRAAKDLPGEGGQPLSLQGPRRTSSPLARAPGAPGPVLLKARHAPWARFVGMTLAAVFWNGLISVFVWLVIEAWRQPGASWIEKWFLPVFLTPFVLAGLFLIGLAVYYFLAMFNPGIALTLSSCRIIPRENLDVAWRMHGRVQVLQRLQIYLEGREEATYARGTRTHTDTAVFARINLANTTLSHELRAGHARATIPPDTMPSFEADHNKILWFICVQGDIARWPDLKEEFPITILPPKPIPPQEI